LTNCFFCQKLASIPSLPSEELVWNFPNSFVLLGKWQFYQGYCIVVAKQHERELNALPSEIRHAYFDEQVFQPLKLNYELLGNQVSHLHWHLFPRYQHDPETLMPVWLRLDRADKNPEENQRCITSTQTSLQTANLLRNCLEKLGAKKDA
jgi:diadenosine tetraphosphate (Ap4A) HIT family hydrolase